MGIDAGAILFTIKTDGEFRIFTGHLPAGEDAARLGRILPPLLPPAALHGVGAKFLRSIQVALDSSPSFKC